MSYERTEIAPEAVARQMEICDRMRAMYASRTRRPLAMVDTFGCQQNEADSEKLRGYLRAMGFGFTDDSFAADVVVLNTCAVREHAEQRVLGNVGALTHTKEQNPDQIVAVCGCMVQQAHMAEKLKRSYRVVDLVFGPHELWRFPELLERVAVERRRVFETAPADGAVVEGIPLQRDGSVKAWLSIMYGCNNFCTYCVVPYVRGRERSRRPEDIVAEARALVAAGEGAQDQALASIVRRLEAADVPVEFVSKARLDSMSSHGAHQGIMVQSRPFAYADLSDIIRRSGEGDALVVLLDHVTDEGNFGAIVRSAEVVGAAGVVIAKARSAGVGTAAYKTSAGAVLHVPIAQVSNLATAIDRLKDAGFWVAGSTEHARQDVWQAPMGGRLCLVMGSEGNGISRLVREKCDFECKLPQRGTIESLNVAQATTVMCYEWLRRSTEAQGGA